MKTTYNIPDQLIADAMKAADVGTKTQAIVIALSELIQRRKSKMIFSLKGTMKGDYNYKATRRKG